MSALSPYRVLLVDDDAALRKVIGRILAGGRYTIVEAESAEQASSIVRTSDEAFDVVMSDVVMAGTDGYTLAAELRDSVGAVILMSGYPVSPAKLAPDVTFLSKPFTPQELRDCLAKALPSEGAR